MLKVETDSFRVLIAGYINLNVIDGSAFFISGLASMLSELPSVEVSVLTANPIEKTDVLDEVMYRSNVTVIDPYAESNSDQFGEVKTGSSMTRAEYAALISQVRDNFDAILLRDTESAFHLVQKSPEIGPRLFAYVTGIHTVDQDVDASLKHQLEEILSRGAKLVCQTEYIEAAIKQVVPGIRPDDVYILTPHVPDGAESFQDTFVDRQRYDRFVYTGKFFEDWNTDKILASFKDVNNQGCELSLDVAGDQFRHSKTNPGFVRNNRWLLDSTPGVHWYGRVPRGQSRKIIESSDIGIGWRSESLNESAELSTKILEYGILGRPSILNRTPLHERLLGVDYPLFANSMTEFKELLVRIPDDIASVKLAANRCYDLALKFSYSSVRPGLLRYLGNTEICDENSSSVRIDQMAHAPEELLAGKHHVLLRGQWAIVQKDVTSKESVGDQLRAVLDAQTINREVENALRERKGLFLNQMSGGAYRSQAVNKASNSAVSGNYNGGPNSTESSLQKIERLEQHIREIETLHNETQARLSALQKSRLGSIQLEIWRQKRGSVSALLPSTSPRNDVLRRLLSKLLRTSQALNRRLSKGTRS